MKKNKCIWYIFLIPFLILGHSITAFSETYDSDLSKKVTFESAINYVPSGSTPIERSEDITEYMQNFTGNPDISFEGFITDDEENPISTTPTVTRMMDNRIKADPTLSPYKQCGYLETYFFDGTSIYTKQGTGALIDGNRFVTAGSMLYSHEHFTGWATSSLIWVASQDGRGTLEEFPTSGQNGGTRFTSMNGWTNSANPRYDLGYIILNSPLEHLSGRLDVAIPTEGMALSNVVSYSGNLFEQMMWGNETFVINTPELLFHDITVSNGSIGAPIIQNSAIVGVTTTLEKQGNMSQALAIRQEIYSFFSPQ